MTNTQTATYENTVVISRAVSDGVYTCSVHNSRGSAISSVGIGSEFKIMTTTCACTCMLIILLLALKLCLYISLDKYS